MMPSLYVQQKVLMYNMSDVPVNSCRCPHPLHSPGQMPRPQAQRLLLVVSLGEAHPILSLLGNSRMHQQQTLPLSKSQHKILRPCSSSSSSRSNKSARNRNSSVWNNCSRSISDSRLRGKALSRSDCDGNNSSSSSSSKLSSRGTGVTACGNLMRGYSLVYVI